MKSPLFSTASFRFAITLTNAIAVYLLTLFLVPKEQLLLPAVAESKQYCSKNVEALSSKLIADLPDYANRVIQITQDDNQEAGIYNYIIYAGKLETEPLNLPQIDYAPTASDSTEQIFFTTKERQYFNQEKIERETYHWLFVTLTQSGWHLVTMFSRFGNETKNTPPTPPQESSNGIIGQAVSIWLRDCRANAVR